MATQKDIELAERFVAALELELDEISRRLNRPTPEIFTENVKWNQAVRALIAHAKKTVPAEPQPGNCPEMPDSSTAKPIPIPEGYRELTAGDFIVFGDLWDDGDRWIQYTYDPSSHVHVKYDKGFHVRHVRKIETAKPSEIPKGSPTAHNPANADDYNTMHDYFGK